MAPFSLAPPASGNDTVLRWVVPVERSLMAIAAGYLGLVSLIPIFAPLAIIIGILAVRDIKRSGGRKHGLGRAWFGILAGSTVLIGLIVLFAASAR
jgi:hypothetical protein